MDMATNVVDMPRAESDTRRCGCTFLLTVRVSTGPYTFFGLVCTQKGRRWPLVSHNEKH
jgi:hypothetical protein